jgi:hypothetical protein
MVLHAQLDELISTLLPFVKEFHARGQLGAHAASINSDGEVIGSALIVEKDRHLSASEALNYFESTFRQAAQAREIVASGIFYHGVGLADPARAAQTEDEACTLVALLEHQSGQSVIYVVPYRLGEPNGSDIVYLEAESIPKPAAIFLV